MTDMTAPEPFDRQRALSEVARSIISSALTIGSVLLSAFGFVERVVGIERIATDRRFALLALMPGAAALAFLASGRALGSLYDVSVPPREIGVVRRALLRFTDISGAYGLFALVISALVAVSTLLASSLLLDLKLAGVSMATGVLAFFVALSGMLMRYSSGRRIIDFAFVAAIVAAMIVDTLL
jgi:hypothetical protein